MFGVKEQMMTLYVFILAVSFIAVVVADHIVKDHQGLR